MQHEVIEFWFNQIDKKKWFSKDEEFDDLIRSRFDDFHTQATKCELFSWRGTALERIDGSPPGNLKHLLQLESIGGRGDSIVVSVADQSIDSQNVRSLISARTVVGVIYENQ